MSLGLFSLSLSVQDIQASKSFYETIGFEVCAGCGSVEDKWLMMKNGKTLIGLFQGMFEDNILTFNPDDARALESEYKANGIQIDSETKGESGPAFFMVRDPDGNQLMFDQS
jgi:catechol 2,3-dioxygenase-like lactoylglutathione lyase family enzyme